MTIKLTYLPESDDNNGLPAQPVMVRLAGNKHPTKLVPVKPLVKYDRCLGCIGELDLENKSRVSCFRLPNCDDVNYVRASHTNILRHIEWRLENDR